jgi:hypothetical protein
MPVGAIVKLPAGDAPPAGCPAYRFVAATVIRAAAPPPQPAEGKGDAALPKPTSRGDEMVVVSYTLSPFISGRALELADVVLVPSLANQELADVFGSTWTNLPLEAFARIASHEVKRAQLWASLPKRWAKVLAWGVHLALGAGLCLTVVLYALTDERLAEPSKWFERVLLPVMEGSAAKVFLAEPCVVLVQPLMMLLIGWLPEDVRSELQHTILEPFAQPFAILADLMSLF